MMKLFLCMIVALVAVAVTAAQDSNVKVEVYYESQ